MKTLYSYLDGYEIEVGRHSSDYGVILSFIDILGDDFPLLYDSYNPDDLEEEIEVELLSEYHDTYNSSYYFHFSLSTEIEDKFKELYPEKII